MTFTTSPTTAKLDEALAKAQGEMGVAVENATNPHFKSTYADLASVWQAIRAPLTKHGLSVTQWPCHSDDGRLHLVTRLAHSGEWMQSEYSSPIGAQTPQALGSAITYAKRYCLMAILGIPSEDDDGNAATESVNLAPKINQTFKSAAQVIVAKPKVISSGPRNYAVEAGWTGALPTCMEALIPFGKQKGQPLMGISVDEAKKMAEWVIDTANKEGKPVSKSWGKFCAAVQDYVLNSAPALTETDVPMFDMNSPTSIHQ
jgi:hypothetical protein